MTMAAPALHAPSVSKARFKAQALELLRQVEATGQALIVTDHGRPVVRVVPYQADGGIAELQTAWARRVASGEVAYDATQAVAPLPPEAWGELT